MPAITLSEADHGTTVSLQPGDQLTVQLSSNPTTGYNWDLAPNPDFSISHAFDPGNGGQGGGGRDLFTLVPQAQGQSGTLQFVYKRAWERSAGEKQCTIHYRIG